MRRARRVRGLLGVDGSILSTQFPGGMKTVLVDEDFEPQGAASEPSGHGVTAGDLAVYAPSYGGG